MNTKTIVLLSGFVFATAATNCGQVGIGPCLSCPLFTRITTGDVATETGDHIGVAWGDYDNDGYIDLFLAKAFGQNNALFRNNRDGTFSRITTGDIVNDGGDARACAWGDYDEDGYLDLIVANTGEFNFLYKNNHNGTFTRITAGTAGPVANTTARFVQPSWADYDNDGWLDLFVSAGGTFSSQNNFLYRNTGTGSFEQVTVVNVGNDIAASFGGAWADYDGDGRIDLFVANGSGQRNFLYRNTANGTFTKTTNSVVTQAAPNFTGGAWADCDNDGDLDLFVSNWSNVGGAFVGHNFLFRNDGSGVFTPLTGAEAGPIVSDVSASTGSAWGDYNNDGWIDLFVCNEGGPGFNYLYRNNGDGTFSRIPPTWDQDVGDYFEGCAWGDYDNDGFLDLMVTGALGTPNLLYRNNGNFNRWLTLKLEGSASNRSAIGAKVRVQALVFGTNLWQTRQISGDAGENSQNDLRAHFGLGNATNTTVVRVEWPSGIVQELRDAAVNKIHTLKEPPKLTVVGLGEAGELRLNLQGGRAWPYTIEYSTNLAHWRWLTNFTATDLLTPITDPGAISAPARFYRAWEGD
jgi:hypothetical protein